MNKNIIIAGLFIIVLGVGYAAFAVPREHSDAIPHEDKEAAASPSLAEAEFSFQVTDIKRNGKVVSFTIPKDAHAVEDKADAVLVSGMYVGDKGEHTECPLVESTAVDDKVEDYDPFSGKARVNATFTDEEMAKEATDKGCVLIRD